MSYKINEIRIWTLPGLVNVYIFVFQVLFLPLEVHSETKRDSTL